MRKCLSITFLLLSTFLPLSACAESSLYNRLPKTGTVYSNTYRYKITVEVETPEGIKTGSAVREITAQDRTKHFVAGVREGCGFQAKGEAVVVDLGARGVLFVLLTQGGGSTDHMWQIVAATFPREGKIGGHCLEEGIKYYVSLKAKGDVPLKAMPMMVTFKDMNDPTSVQYVYGIEEFDERFETKRGTMARRTSWRVKEDNFEKLFGQGVKLHSVKLEMTNEPVTDKVEQWLPSFGKDSNFAKWRISLPYGHPLSIDRTSFSMGYITDGK